VTAPDPEGAGRSRREGPQTSRPAGADQPRTGQLLVTGIALSIDNLAIGFALGAYHVNLAAAAVIIGAVSVPLSLAGLELGDRLGTNTQGLSRGIPQLGICPATH
jgi:manganese efflux pump family protein